MDNLEKLLDEKRKNSRLKRPKYGLRKLSVGLVSCVLGYVIFSSPQIVSAQGVIREEKTVIESEEAVVKSKLALEEILSANYNVKKADSEISNKSSDLNQNKEDLSPKDLSSNIEKPLVTESKSSEEISNYDESLSNLDEQERGINSSDRKEEKTDITEEKQDEKIDTKSEEKSEDKTEINATEDKGEEKPSVLEQEVVRKKDEKAKEVEANATDEANSLDKNSETKEDRSSKEYKESDILKDEKIITDGKGYRQSEIAGGGPKVRVLDNNLGEEKEGVRVETLQPSADSDDKKSFGIELNIDKTKSDRTYNGFLITDSGIGKEINPKKSEFLKPGEILPTDKEDEVTYQPDIDNLDYRKGRQSGFNYYSSEEDRKHLANKDTSKTTLAWKGEYDKDNPNGKFLTGDNFEVTVGVNPYPNENKDLSLIEIEGNTTISRVPVKNQFIVTGAKIKNAGSEDYTRLVGEVYHPEEDIIVDGAKAIIVSPDNIENLKLESGNSNLVVGDIILKMPEGALQGDGSIFNDNKFKGVQNLRARFYARPRTKDEFSKLANDLLDYDGDTTYGYVSTGAGTREIIHNGKKIIIDRQGIDRYDHYNLIGEMTINLDDTKNYDQSFGYIDGDNKHQDTEDHTSIAVKPGEELEVSMYTPEDNRKKDNQKTADEMKESEKIKDATGRLIEDFVEVENKKIAKELGKTVEELDREEKWVVNHSIEDITKFTVTAPKRANAGDFIAIPVEYKYTNGSTDTHWFHFVVQASDNYRPEYFAEIGFQGDTLTKNHEQIPTDTDKNKPTSYELETSKYKDESGNVHELEVGSYRDNAGNIWTGVTIDEKTGAVTATIPEDIEVVGGENLYVPIKVNYENGKSEHVKAQFIARPKFSAKGGNAVVEEIPFETKIIYDETLNIGEVKKTDGELGSKKTIYEWDYDSSRKNDKLNEDRSVKDIVRVETIKEKKDAIIRIGIKPIEKTVNINRPIEITVDENLKSGDKVVDEEGMDGVVTVKTTRNPKTGEIKTTTEETTAPVAKKIRVGLMTNGEVVDEDEIPFKIDIVKDPTLKKGEYVVDKEGTPGKNKKTWAIKNSQIVGEVKVDKVDPVNAKVRVGELDFTGVITHDVDEKIPFEVEIVEDTNLESGKSVIEQKGVEGSKTTKYTQAVKNGEAVGELKSEVTNDVKPIKQIIRVGKKPATNEKNVKTDVPVEIEYVYDPTKPVTKAETGEFTPGKVETIVTNKYNPETGKIETSEKTIITPAKQKIIVGIHKFTGALEHKLKEIIPFETKIEFDDNLPHGEQRVVVEGNNGEKTKTIKQNFENGEQTGIEVLNEEITVKKIDRVIKVGSMTNGEHEYVEKIPFKYLVQYDENLKSGEYKIEVEGKEGSKTTKWTIKNSKVTDKTEKINVQPVNALIKVGSKDFTGTFKTIDKDKILFDIEYKVDPNLKPGEEIVEQEGKVGEEQVVTIHTIKNGEVIESKTGNKEVNASPVKKIVRIGAKTDGTYIHKEEVAFDVEVRVNEKLQKGDYKVVQQGEKGEKKTTVTIENSKVVGKPNVETTKEAKKHIIEVGNKDFTGEVTHKDNKKIPFEVEIVENPNLIVGKTNVIQQGEAGEKEIIYTQAIKNGQSDGNLKTQEKETRAAKKHIIEVGTKPVEGNTHNVDENVNVEIEYVYDNTLYKGTVQKGDLIPGKVISKLVNKIENGKVVTLEEKMVTPAKQIIKVGSKDYTGTFEYVDKEIIPFETEYKIDPNLKPGEEMVEKEGKLGEKETKITQNFTNGEKGELVKGSTKITQIAENRIVRIGAKTDGTIEKIVDIGYKTNIIYDDNMISGESKIVQEGKNGKKKLTISVVNSKETETKTEIVDEAQDRIIRIGTMCKAPTPDVKPEPNPDTKPEDPNGGGDENSKKDSTSEIGKENPKEDKPSPKEDEIISDNKGDNPTNKDSTTESEDKSTSKEEKISVKPNADEINNIPETKEDSNQKAKEEIEDSNKDENNSYKAKSEEKTKVKKTYVSKKDDSVSPKTFDGGVASYAQVGSLASLLVAIMELKKRRKDK